MPDPLIATSWRAPILQALAIHYRLSGTLHVLYGYADFNYHLQCDGRQTGLPSGSCSARTKGEFIVKLMHPDTAINDVEVQIQILQHLQHTAASSGTLSKPPTSTLVTTVDGATTISVTHEGITRTLWVLKYLPGVLAADFQPISTNTLKSLGTSLAQLHDALANFDHPHLDREFSWRLLNLGWLSTHISALDQQAQPLTSALTATIQTMQQASTQALLKRLPTICVHGDLNEHNVLLNKNGMLSGILDFGDTHRAPRVVDLAIAACYFMMQADQSIVALGQLVGAYHATCPLSSDEQTLLLPLIRLRLAQSLTHASQHLADPTLDDAARQYRLISLQPAQELWRELDDHRDGFVAAWIRHSCNDSSYDAIWTRIRAALAVTPPTAMFNVDLASAYQLKLHPASGEPRNPFSGDMPDPLQQFKVDVAVGGYGEPRLVYQASAFKSNDHPVNAARTIHAGVDVFIAPGTPLYAPLDSVVHVVDRRSAEQDYGPIIILRHTLGIDTFFTLYGHLDPEVTFRLEEGQRLQRGDLLAHIGAPPDNGNWPPHLHLQCVLDDFAWGSDIDGVCHRWSWPLWQRIFPNPAALLGVANSLVAHEIPNDDALVVRREKVLGRNLSIAYNRPVQVVRGWQQYLFDQYGRCYLDAYNNVPHVGHCHPHVEAAITRQTRTLSTNTRYLHPTILDYTEKLTTYFPAPLNVAFLLNSASEANELALRLARAVTGARDMLVIDDAYHGHTTSLIDISPYKAEGPGGNGCAEWVHRVPTVDTYRGEFRGANAGRQYAQHIADALSTMQQQQRKLCAWIAESLPSVGGQLVFPPGYLKDVYAQVRAVGGLCIADEVQTGFGRTGDHFWGFEQQDVVPDMVVLGKPIGNGYPLAAVITTEAIAEQFANGMEFFSTFGGNTVACAAGLAVLDVVEQENTQAHCKKVGDYLMQRLHDRVGSHPLVGDIRGMGLFQGIELVTDQQRKTPASAAAQHTKNRLREHGILIGTDGPHDNVLKIRPPTPFNQSDADFLSDTLRNILTDTVLR